MLAVFSVYDILAYVLVGGLLVAGSYGAIAGVPAEPGAGAILGLIACFYAAGHLVQGVATVWERRLWRTGSPSLLRVEEGHPKAYSEPLQEALRASLDRFAGFRPDGDGFAMARAVLRQRGLDGRSELMNLQYGLCRGLATSSGLLIGVFATCAMIGTERRDVLIAAAALATVAAVLFAIRSHRFSYRFADQVWRDFAAAATDTGDATGRGR
jgi:hypothetical protein